MEEIWRNVKDFEGLYQVSNLGRVRSLDHYVNSNGGVRLVKGVLIKPKIDSGGYMRVTLHKNDTHKNYQLHRLVGMTFPDLIEWTECAKGKPFNKLQINHKDENPSNNNINNLQWCVVEDNLIYGTRLDRIKEKLINGKKSKSVSQYTIDGQFVAEYPSIAEAYRQTHILSSYICKCLKGYDKFETAGGYIWKYTSNSLDDKCGGEIP